jgi:glycosyltransferase involved in cell wall biosynthesis
MLNSEEEINNFLKHENYYNGNILINNPKPIFGQTDPVLSYYYSNNKGVEYSVIIPVHNQELIIKDNLLSIINNMVGDFEIIMIFDSCQDNSESISIEFFKNNNFSGLNRVILISQSTPIFETSCDNIGFRLANGKYLLEIQSDIRIITFGFNFILSKPFRISQDVLAVSGRCAHQNALSGYLDYTTDFFYYKSATSELRPKRKIVAVGKFGNAVESSLSIEFKNMNKFFILDTCNRGPLMFLKEKIEQLGFLDEQNFVLGDDEHDLIMRAKCQKNWVSGYVPIEFLSPLNWGTSRKIKNIENEEYLKNRMQRSNGGFLVTTKDIIPSDLEIRDLNKTINYRNEKEN